MTKKPSGS